MKKTRMLAVIVLLFVMTTAGAWPEVKDALSISSRQAGLGANDLGYIAHDGSALWITGSGTINMLSGDGNNVNDWLALTGEPGFGRGSISAVYAEGDTIIIAWSYNDERETGAFVSGDGFSISVDHGQTWQRTTITDLFPSRKEFAYPGTYTMIYDITRQDSLFWCSVTSGFILKSSDIGDPNSWEWVLPDSCFQASPDSCIDASPDSIWSFANPNHHGYCIDIYGDTLWVGTFEGINRSFDGGEHWVNFSSLQPDSLVPGDNLDGWVYTIEHNYARGATHIWVGADQESATGKNLGEYGIFHSDDNGLTWEKASSIYNAWNFAFGRDNTGNPVISSETIFAASDSGLVVSYDLGATWEIIEVEESGAGCQSWEDGLRISDVKVFGDTLWVTSSDGLARSADWGETWTIFKGITRVKTIDEGAADVGVSSRLDNVKTYAYPNPFSPKRGDFEYSRAKIQYALSHDAAVTIKIYNYQSRLIRTILDNVQRTGGRDHQDVWDGRDKNGRIVPNGVYFYVITTNRGHSARGKIMVLD